MTSSKQEAPNSSDVGLPEKVTLAWLSRHIPVQAWLALAGITGSAFVLGLTIGGAPLLQSVADDSSSGAAAEHLSASVVHEVQQQLDGLAEGHNKRMSALNEAYLGEERNAADSALLSSFQREHAAAAQRLLAAMREERQAVAAQLAEIRSLMVAE